MKLNSLVVASLITATANVGLRAQVPDAPMGTALLELKEKASQKERGSIGTGFFVRHSDFSFLVTAKHVIWDVGKTNSPLRGSKLICLTHSVPYEPGKKVIIFEADLNVADRTKELRKHADRDVAVLRLSRTAKSGEGEEWMPHIRFLHIGLTNPISASANATYASRFNDVSVGEEAILVGFPMSLGMQNAPQLGPHEPLVEKTLISGKNPVRKTLIIGSPVYPGNSGGAVWRVDRRNILNTTFSLAGVITELIPFDESGLVKASGRTNINVGVSGYSVAEPIDFVIELLEQEWQ